MRSSSSLPRKLTTSWKRSRAFAHFIFYKWIKCAVYINLFYNAWTSTKKIHDIRCITCMSGVFMRWGKGDAGAGGSGSSTTCAMAAWSTANANSRSRHSSCKWQSYIVSIKMVEKYTLYNRCLRQPTINQTINPLIKQPTIIFSLTVMFWTLSSSFCTFTSCSSLCSVSTFASDSASSVCVWSAEDFSCSTWPFRESENIKRMIQWLQNEKNRIKCYVEFL